MRGEHEQELTIMMTKISLAKGVGLGLILCGCGTAAPGPDDRDERRETPPLELPDGQRLAATARTETSTVYFVAAEHGINMLEIGDMSRFEPVLARLTTTSTPLEIYLALTGSAESDAPEELILAHYGALGVAPRLAAILPASALQEKAVETFGGATELDVSGMENVRPEDALIDKAAPRRLAFSFFPGAPAECDALGAFFLAYYGHWSVSGFEPTFAGCNSPNVCFTTGSSTFSQSGIGSIRSAAGCNGKAGSAQVVMLTEKNAPFCPPCPPALPYRGPIFLLDSGESFFYAETGGDFAGSLRVTTSGSGSGTLATVAVH